MKKNDQVELEITDLTTDGKGVGKTDGLAVFVDGALPGEHVLAHIILLKKNYAVGKLMEILSPSPQREKPPCPYFTRCGGCTLQHLSYSGQLEYKHRHVTDCISRIAKLDIPVHFPLPSRKDYRYRNKAAFPVRMQNGVPEIGLYALRSHNVVDIDDCLLQHLIIKIVMSQLRVWIVKHGISIYDEQTGKGLLRHVLLRTDNAGEVMLVLVINGEDIPHKADLHMLFEFVLPQVKSIMLNINTEQTNVILGSESTVLFGRDHFYEMINGLEFKVGPTSFLQVNTPQAEVLYNNLFRQLDILPTDTVLDLYCGIGTITLHAARQAKAAYGIEVNAAAIKDAEFNAAYNDIENAFFLAGDALASLPEVTAKAGSVDIVIADPPRKGLSEALIQKIAALSPRKVGYVSCDPATLARDMALFAQHGYHAGHVQPVDLFPQTTHVECITVMIKADC